MRVSAITIEKLAKIITGDGEGYQYRSGPQLVEFFNDFGFSDFYYSGFPSRFSYAKEKLNLLNGKEILLKVIEEALDPVHYEKELASNDVAARLNKYLVKDGYRIAQYPRPRSDMSQDYYTDIEAALYVGDLKDYPADFFEKYFTVEPLGNKVVEIESSVKLSHDFINEQINKTKAKLTQSDFDGAITNARSLVEAFQEEIIRKTGLVVPKYDGDLLKLYKVTKKALNLDPAAKDLSDTLKQILSGLNSLVSGLGGLSNKMADRHARSYKPSRHHAKLAVNVAFTFCEFLLDSFEHQQEKKGKGKKES